MIEPGLALRGKLHDLPNARPNDEIVGEGQEKKDRDEPQLNSQNRRPSRWIRDRNPSLMQQQGAREQEHCDHFPDHHPESAGHGQKEQCLL
jgi:hypothetical protein